MLHRSTSSQKRSDRGQTLAEFAIVLPLLALLIFGLVDVTRLYRAYVTVQGAAREAARYGVTGQSDCAGATDRADCIQDVAKEQTASLANSGTAVNVSVDSWQFPAYTVENTAGDPGAQCDLLQVTVEYAFKPSTPIIGSIIGPIHLFGHEKMVNEPFGPCSSS